MTLTTAHVFWTAIVLVLVGAFKAPALIFVGTLILLGQGIAYVVNDIHQA